MLLSAWFTSGHVLEPVLVMHVSDSLSSLCLLPRWEAFANTNYRIWSVGIFLLKEGCLCRDSCQNTVTVSETLNIATSLVTSLQVCRYMYLSTYTM